MPLMHPKWFSPEASKFCAAQMVVAFVNLQFVDAGVVGAYPTTQVHVWALQPRPPASHCSSGSTTPLPHVLGIRQGFSTESPLLAQTVPRGQLTSATNAPLSHHTKELLFWSSEQTNPVAFRSWQMRVRSSPVLSATGTQSILSGVVGLKPAWHTQLSVHPNPPSHCSPTLISPFPHLFTSAALQGFSANASLLAQNICSGHTSMVALPPSQRMT